MITILGSGCATCHRLETNSRGPVRALRRQDTIVSGRVPDTAEITASLTPSI